MKIGCISDLHGKLPTIEPCDVLIISGDICPHTTSPGSFRDMSFQAQWLRYDFRNWMDSLPVKNIVAVAGNHDFVFERMASSVPSDLPWKYLLRNSVEVDGLKIWGTPDQLPFYNWAFNVEEHNLKAEYQMIPSDTDIIISHGPPFGYGDLVPKSLSSPNAGEHVGSESLIDHIKKYQPQLVVVGHIHSGYGIYTVGKTQIVNASVLDEAYELVNDPIYMDIKPRV